jgi:hypothetical protein
VATLQRKTKVYRLLRRIDAEIQPLAFVVLLLIRYLFASYLSQSAGAKGGLQEQLKRTDSFTSLFSLAHFYLFQIVIEALTQGSRGIAIFAGDWRDFDFELGSLPKVYAGANTSSLNPLRRRLHHADPTPLPEAPRSQAAKPALARVVYIGD